MATLPVPCCRCKTACTCTENTQAAPISTLMERTGMNTTTNVLTIPAFECRSAHWNARRCSPASVTEDRPLSQAQPRRRTPSAGLLRPHQHSQHGFARQKPAHMFLHCQQSLISYRRGEIREMAQCPAGKRINSNKYHIRVQSAHSAGTFSTLPSRSSPLPSCTAGSSSLPSSVPDRGMHTRMSRPLAVSSRFWFWDAVTTPPGLRWHADRSLPLSQAPPTLR